MLAPRRQREGLLPDRAPRMSTRAARILMCEQPKKFPSLRCYVFMGAQPLKHRAQKLVRLCVF